MEATARPVCRVLAHHLWHRADRPWPLPARRAASVEATTRLVCLVLARDTFVAILGPLEALMAREKSVAVVSQRLARLASKGAGPHMPAEVLIKRRRRSRAGGDAWEVVRARGHLDEVQALRSIAAGAHALVPLSWGGLHFLPEAQAWLFVP